MKFVVFNVGGALCTYAEHKGTQVVIDIGKGNGFSPVNDFMLPLFRRRNFRKSGDKYRISQLIVSHPHKDHLSDIQDFCKHFNPYLITCPNDKTIPKSALQNVNWSAIDTPDDSDVQYLKQNIIPRNLPLKVVDSEHMIISYLYPGYVEQTVELTDESYTNNISIATYLNFGKYSVFLPGDLQKIGMQRLLDTGELTKKAHDRQLRKALSQGVDFLVCPHHGLKSSFSTELFSCMKDGKTRKLNIVSEKSTKYGDNRIVDSRYSKSDYCAGYNNLSTTELPVYQRKTSNGHIFINDDGNVIITSDINDVVELFI